MTLKRYTLKLVDRGFCGGQILKIYIIFGLFYLTYPNIPRPPNMRHPPPPNIRHPALLTSGGIWASFQLSFGVLDLALGSSPKLVSIFFTCTAFLPMQPLYIRSCIANILLTISQHIFKLGGLGLTNQIGPSVSKCDDKIGSN